MTLLAHKVRSPMGIAFTVPLTLTFWINSHGHG